LRSSLFSLRHLFFRGEDIRSFSPSAQWCLWSRRAFLPSSYATFHYGNNFLCPTLTPRFLLPSTSSPSNTHDGPLSSMLRPLSTPDWCFFSSFIHFPSSVMTRLAPFVSVPSRLGRIPKRYSRPKIDYPFPLLPMGSSSSKRMRSIPLLRRS